MAGPVAPVGAAPFGSGRPAPLPTIPDHQLLSAIGHGSYGEVWLARNVLGELRAVKLIYRSRFADPRPFEREFEGIQRFEPISRSHPSQLSILHVGKNDQAGCFYYVMELADNSRAEGGARKGASQEAIDGHAPDSYTPHTLRHDLQQRGRLPIPRCVQIGLSLTTALEHLHSQGLVHRDIKPSNVIFVNDVPKLSDIGLVTQAGDTHSIVGTEGYIPPEGPGTPEADIFALGKVLYEISTGLDRRRFSELPEDLREWQERKELIELNEILLKACAKDPARRYRSAKDMREELGLLQCGKSVKQRRTLQRGWAGAKKLTVAISSGALFVGVSLFLTRGPNNRDIHSSVAGVDSLVKQGNVCLLSETPERLETAMKFFKRALFLDPRYVPAQYGIFGVDLKLESTRDDLKLIPTLAAEAKKLNAMGPNLAEAHVALSQVSWLEWKFADALKEDRMAVRLPAAAEGTPASAHLLYGYHLIETGHPEAALEQYQKADALSPANPTIKHHLGHPYFVRHDFAEALKNYQSSLNLEPRHLLGHYWKGRVYVEMDQFDNAIDEFEATDRAAGESEAVTKPFYDHLRKAAATGGAQGYWRARLEEEHKNAKPNPYYLATLYARLRDKQNAYAFLDTACEQRAFTEGLMFDLCWDHQDKRFRQIARRFGLLE